MTIYPLEDRILFDAAIAVDLNATQDKTDKQAETTAHDATADHAATAQDAATAAAGTDVQGTHEVNAALDSILNDQSRNAASDDPHLVTLSADATPRIVYVVDSSLPNVQTLIDALPAGSEVHWLDNTKDGLDQLLAIVESGKPVSALHLVTHGEPGRIQLGNIVLTEVLVNERAAAMQELGTHLTADADILIWGCDVAQSTNGQHLIDTIATLTGADVAASDDPTGSLAQGGDWTLEYVMGAINNPESQLWLNSGYDQVLFIDPIDLGGVNLKFNNYALYSGTDKAVNAVYKYTNVATINGIQIDAYITILSITNASLTTIDNNTPTGFVPPAGMTIADIWAPEVSTSRANGGIEFSIQFKDTSLNPLTLIHFYNNSIDVDSSSSTLREFVEYGGFQSYTVSNPTDLLITSGSGDRMRFTGTGNYNGWIDHQRRGKSPGPV